MSKRIPVPGMGDGVVLGEPEVPRTSHTTTFHASQVGIYCALNEEGIVVAYQIRIIDPHEAHTYVFEINNQQVWKDVIAGIDRFPLIGQKAEEELRGI